VLEESDCWCWQELPPSSTGRLGRTHTTGPTALFQPPNPLNQTAGCYIDLSFVVGHRGINPVTVVCDLDVPLNGKMFIMLTS